MKYVISMTKKVALIFSLMMLLCPTKLLSIDNQDQPNMQDEQCGEFLLNNLDSENPIFRGGCKQNSCCKQKDSCCKQKAASCKLVLNQPSLTALQILQLLVALQELQGPNGPIILQGLQGLPGLEGIQGIPGIPGSQGFIGLDGVPGIQGIPGVQGLLGLQGIQGPIGTSGLNGVISSAQYVQLGSQPGAVAAGQPFTYTTAVLTTPGVTATTTPPPGGTIFTLVNIGRYEVNYQMVYPTDGGVVLYAGATPTTMLPLPYTMIGKSPNGAVAGSVIIETTTSPSYLSVNAAPGNSAAIVIPPNSSTTNQSATTVSFKQIF